MKGNQNPTPTVLDTPLDVTAPVENEPIVEETYQDDALDTTSIPKEVLNEARTKYGADQVKVLELALNEERSETLDILVRVPTREIVGEYEKYSDRQPVKAKTILVKACVLTSSARVMSDDGLFNGTVNLLAEMIPVRRGRIKNL